MDPLLQLQTISPSAILFTESYNIAVKSNTSSADIEYCGDVTSILVGVPACIIDSLSKVDTVTG